MVGGSGGVALAWVVVAPGYCLGGVARRGRACGCVHGMGRWHGGQCGRGRFVWVVGWGGVAVGYVCAEGMVGWAGALWAEQWVEKMLVTPTGGVL